MATRKKVLAHKHRKSSMGLAMHFTVFTCMHYWGAPGWLYGAWGAVVLFWVVAVICEWCTTDDGEPVWKDKA